jgi:hypothetical protein
MDKNMLLQEDSLWDEDIDYEETRLMLWYNAEEARHRAEEEAALADQRPSTSYARSVTDITNIYSIEEFEEVDQEAADTWEDIEEMFSEADRLEIEIIANPKDSACNLIKREKIRCLRMVGNELQLDHFGFVRMVRFSKK